MLLARRPPAGSILAAWLGCAARFARGLWWFHLVLVFGFVSLIPYTKLRHIFTTSTNAFLVPLEPKGPSPPSTWKTNGAAFGGRPSPT